MKRRLLGVFVFAVIAGACATAGGPSEGSTSHADRNLLTTEQIEAANLPNAYELVNRLRRPWLRDDPATGRPAVVYMDDREVGGVEVLRDIPAVTVAELRLVPNEEAIMRWNSGIQGSVIVIIPRR